MTSCCDKFSKSPAGSAGRRPASAEGLFCPYQAEQPPKDKAGSGLRAGLGNASFSLTSLPMNNNVDMRDFSQ